jgi:photosystem II stability/assembly factor-like uncharacterized protein
MRQKLLLFASVLSLTFFSQKGFGQWVQTTAVPGDSVFTDCFAVSGSNLVAGTQGEATDNGNRGILLSTDNGATWTASSTGLPINENVFALMEIDPNSLSPMLFAGTEGGVFFSTDHGISWTAANNGFPPTQHAISFAVIGANSSSSTIFVGTNQEGVYRSTDNGASWTASGLLNMTVIALAVSGSNLIAGGTGPNAGIYLSTDNGLHWTADTTGLPPYVFIQCVAVSGGNLFAGTLNGVFLSTNNGASWNFVNTGLENTNIDVWTLSAIDTFLYAGSETSILPQFSDIWRRPLSQMIGSSSVPQNQGAMGTEPQAYPNPFPGKTTITISPSEDGVATITIVNLLGQQVAQLFDGELTAGPHSLTWDASNAEPGSYWCIVRMGDRTERIALSVQR